MIQAVVFDYGGVFTPSPFGAAHAYAASKGVEPEAVIDVVFGTYGTDTDHAWHRLERGELTFADALTEISAAADAAGIPGFDVGEMFRALAEDDVDRSVVKDTVRVLRRAGISTAILTNNIREYGDHWREHLGADELFDTVVDSCLEGMRKPNPAIYELVLERLEVRDPAHSVFLDDFEGNVLAARDVGMHGILVGPDPRPALDELYALVGDSSR